MKFHFFMPTNLAFGAGKVSAVSDLIASEKIMIICDPIIEKIGIAEKIARNLEDREVFFFSEVEANPSLDVVNKALEIAIASQVDGIIGLGGGSSLDTAKAVSVVITNGGVMEDYASGRRCITQKRLPLVLIPTTAGTGSECTAVGVFSDHMNNRKFPLFSVELRADAAIIDPELTYTAPPRVTAVTGIDAFTHAIESYWNILDSPITDMVALKACDLVIKNLYSCYENPSNAEARANMSLASLMGGFAFGQTKTTSVHSMSFPLADLYKVDHGTACAITLVPIMRFIYSGAKEKMEKMAAFCGYSSYESFVDAMEELLKKLQIPTKLSEIGGKKEDLDYIVNTTMGFEMTGLMPRKITAEELYELLSEIC
jgi:alcohol dehydrogenase